jgi:hypothetical protein
VRHVTVIRKRVKKRLTARPLYAAGGQARAQPTKTEAAFGGDTSVDQDANADLFLPNDRIGHTARTVKVPVA